MHRPRPLLPHLRALTLATLTTLAATVLMGCASWRSIPGVDIGPLLPADAIMLGEQHDAAEHQQIHAQVVRQLARQGRLASLALEMAELGQSTASLPRNADEEAVRAALQWNDRAWPWGQYGPAVMAAVRAGVPVLGANLPRSRFSSATLDASLDRSLPPDAMATQYEAIRVGHCGLLGSSQVAPMARIQIARDQAMAQTLVAAARPGQVVLLLAGSAHVDRAVGVPQHLPPGFDVKAVRLLAGGKAGAAPAGFDAVWATPPAPQVDHCAQLRRTLGQ